MQSCHDEYTIKAIKSNSFERMKNVLTANFLGGIIEMASGVIPSICSFTKADIAMSGRPAVKSAKCLPESKTLRSRNKSDGVCLERVKILQQIQDLHYLFRVVSTHSI